MTCGIYKMSFKGTTKVYIGQSSNIEQRIVTHTFNFKLGKQSKKLQEAWETYGPPEFNVLAECSLDELDDLENEAIEIFDSINAGFNTLEKAGDIPVYRGSAHGRSLYTNEQIINTMLYIVDNPKIQLKKVAENTGVKLSVIYMIACGKNHTWLRELYPEQYEKMLVLSGTRRLTCQTATNMGRKWPIVVSPEGTLFTIENIKAFAREHGLNDSSLGAVLHGKYKQHKGWRLA